MHKMSVVRDQRRPMKINKNKALEGEDSLIIVSMTKRKGERIHIRYCPVACHVDSLLEKLICALQTRCW